MVKEGSRWAGNGRDVFHVIHVVEIDGHTWYIISKKTHLKMRIENIVVM